LAYWLAKELGRVNVDEMLEEIDGAQLMEWVAFLSIDPEEMQKQRQSAKAFEQIAGARYGNNS